LIWRVRNYLVVRLAPPTSPVKADLPQVSEGPALTQGRGSATIAVVTLPSYETHRGAAVTPARQPLNRPVTLAFAGAGARGSAYAALAGARPRRSRVVAVAEPRSLLRDRIAAAHGVEPAHTFETWQEMAARPRLADAVVVAVRDRDHLEAALAFIARGYDVLLEKPMATTEEDCETIADAAERAGVLLALCHVMRYTPYTKELERLVASGRLGDLVSIQHLEPIGSWHFAHSYVRGNWRREDESTFLLLAKACHDIDWLDALVARPVRRVSSFGSLSHFTPVNAPAGAAPRCLDCKVESDCPFSAVRHYREGLRNAGAKRHYTRIMAPELTEAAVDRALAEGPYGRCVYDCDNDVVDQQSVLIEYEGGITASFLLTAFTPVENRRTRLFGSRAQVTGDGRYLEVYDLLTEKTTVVDTAVEGITTTTEGHAGGDAGLMTAFVDALFEGDTTRIVSSGRSAVDSHRLVFAAERARRTGTVVSV
jgi:predicted dehydrogenase